MSLKATLRAAIAFILTSTPDLGDVKAQFQGFTETLLQSGTGDNQADRVFADTRTLAASANEDLDLAGAGWAVTPGTSDLLRIANSAAGSGVECDVEIIGTSA
jgi:hypothetical protein